MPSPPPDDAPPPDESPDTPPGGPPDPFAGRRLGDPTGERPVPRGCNPLVFGVVMATIQFGCTVYFMRTC